MRTDLGRVERAIEQSKKELEQATSEEQFQTIGLLCREAIVSLAQAVYDANIHLPVDGIIPSNSDAKRMLEAYLQHELQGSSNEAARKFAKSALDLANDLQHRRTASFRDAAMCVEATDALLRVVALISGSSVVSGEEKLFSKIRSLMPELIAEMSADLKGDSLKREFFIIGKHWVMNFPEKHLVYYFEEHKDLQSKIQILENNGLVIDVTRGNAKRYRLMEEFAEYLIALPEADLE